MKKFPLPLFVLLAAPVLFTISNTARAVSITTFGATYTENFDTLASTGTSNSTVPAGWAFAEAGTNANTTYAADDGTVNAGNTYSFGTGTSTERAFGGLQSGTLIPTIGVHFENNTGGTINSLLIDYYGEQWRRGTASRPDQLDFQYSLDGTSLITGTWTDVDALDFAVAGGTTLGALNGNDAANRLNITFTITGLNIGSGSTFWFRWLDFNATGADDGLGIDDFALTAQGTLPGVPESLPFGWVAATLLSILLLGGRLSKRADVPVSS